MKPDVVIPGCVTFWKASSDEVQRSYGNEFFESFIDKVKRSENAARTNIQEVVGSMTHAVTSRSPRALYTCHWTTSVINFILVHVVPLWLQDFTYRCDMAVSAMALRFYGCPVNE